MQPSCQENTFDLPTIWKLLISLPLRLLIAKMHSFTTDPSRLWSLLSHTQLKSLQALTKQGGKKKLVQPLHDCWTISNDPGLKPSSWDHEKNHHSDLKGRLKLPVAPFYLHCPISKGKNKKGAFFIQAKTWVALCHNTLFQWGPEDLLVLSLVIFLWDTAEEWEVGRGVEKKNWDGLMAGSAYCRVFTDVISSIN